MPCTPHKRVACIVKDPKLAYHDILVELTRPIAGPVKMAGVPVKLSATPGAALTPAPLLNHDINAILHDLMGWDEATVKEKLGE